MSTILSQYSGIENAADFETTVQSVMSDEPNQLNISLAVILLIV